MSVTRSLDDPEIEARLRAAGSTVEAASVIADCGYPADQARFMAAVMRGESDGDVITPPVADEPAN